ncbi:phospholipid carrier-dependent glycosyltransferase, partial [Candidatus Parcubacteria bacterium]|nr:phospholipid carrier-dependent glycosyltransferase [Candidatus Parcubacteria bacterium]
MISMTNRRLSFFIILAVSVAAHFLFFGHPNETVFDEVHFGKFTSAYYTHQYYFDIHPPLGKLMIAGFGKIFNFEPEYSFTQIGQTFPDHKYLSLRFLPILAGAILPLVIFLLALELGFAIPGAFTAGMFVALENALLTQSRYILLDPFLLLFGFTSLFFYFRFRNQGNRSSLVWMAIFGGLAVSIKWTGASFLGLAGVIELIYLLRNWSARRFSKDILAFAVIPFIIYFFVFAIHFALLTKSGTGDAFMNPAFQSTLIGNGYQNQPGLKAPNILQKFVQLNTEMYHANQRLTASHPYSSKWYTWPFMIRPIYYWVGSTPASYEEKIYLIGNPLIWWASTVAVLYLLFNAIGE